MDVYARGEEVGSGSWWRDQPDRSSDLQDVGYGREGSVGHPCDEPAAKRVGLSPSRTRQTTRMTRRLPHVRSDAVVPLQPVGKGVGVEGNTAVRA